MRPGLRTPVGLAAAALTLGAAAAVEQMTIDVGESETVATFDNSYMAGVNAAGTVVGHASFPDANGSVQWWAYRSVAGGAPVRLELPTGWRDGIATAVSETDVVIGYAYEPYAGAPDSSEAYQLRAVMWDAAGQFTALPPGDEQQFALSAAYGISPSGRYVVGTAYHPGVGYRATRWEGTVATPMAVVCVAEGSCDYGDVRVVNDAGVAGGAARNNLDSTFRAVRWNADGSSQMLPYPPGVALDAELVNTQIKHIAANGDIYGYVHVYNSPTIGSRMYVVRWPADGSVQDITPPALKQLLPSLYGANDDGLLLMLVCDQGCRSVLSHGDSLTWTETANGMSRYHFLSGSTGDPKRAYVAGQVLNVDTRRQEWVRATVTLRRPNAPPSVSILAEWPAVEGSAVTLSATATDPDGPAPLTYEWDRDGDGSFETTTLTPSVDFTATDNGAYVVKLRAKDAAGAASGVAQTRVVAGNAPPAMGALDGLPVGPIVAGTSLTVSAPFGDPGSADTHVGSVEWDLGHGFTTADVVTRSPTASAAGSVSATRALTAGLYTLALRVQDDDGAVDSRSVAPAYVVVYDPAAALTGNGWISSPAGACQLTSACSAATGKASFAFSARYQSGASTPSGTAEFQFKAGGVSFAATRYEWLVVAGSAAKLKGEGTVNGASGYRFLIAATDGAGAGASDRFRIKIWAINADGTDGSVVYDNEPGKIDDSDASTIIGGGNIAIAR